MKSSQISKEVGDRIKQAREARDWSTMELAQEMGLASATTIQRYERGERTPSLKTLFALARVLGVDVVDLIPVE